MFLRSQVKQALWHAETHQMARDAMRHQTDITESTTGRDWLEQIQGWDPLGLILVAHATALIALGDVVEPVWAAFFAGGLGLWRLSLGIVSRRKGVDITSWILRREGGSLVLAAGVVAADGGTESPFFFWPLILLAWQALHLSVRQLGAMVGLAVTTYVAVVFVTGDLTTESLGRLGLLLSFSAVMLMGRKRLESLQQQAVRSERLLQDAFSAAPVGLMVAPVGAKPAYMNDAARRMGLGLAYEQFEEGKPLRGLVVTAWKDRQTVGPEVFVFHDDVRGPRYLRVMATPHGTAAGEAVIVCAEDVTAQVAAGEEQRSFMRFAGHQLRTPLTPIIAYAELLEAGKVSTSEMGSVAAEIGRSARELQRLFERMVAVASLRDGSERQLNFARAGDIVSRINREMLGGVTPEGDPGTLVWCDPELVAVALQELVDNGHRFGAEPVRLAWARDNGSVEFRVWDAGPGPDQDIPVEALFAQWGELEAPKMMTPEMGSRLGLAHARILVGLSGGQLGLERRDSEWAFVLRLPVSPLGKAGRAGANRPAGSLQRAL